MTGSLLCKVCCVQAVSSGCCVLLGSHGKVCVTDSPYDYASALMLLGILMASLLIHVEFMDSAVSFAFRDTQHGSEKADPNRQSLAGRQVSSAGLEG